MPPSASNLQIFAGAQYREPADQVGNNSSDDSEQGSAASERDSDSEDDVGPSNAADQQPPPPPVPMHEYCENIAPPPGFKPPPKPPPQVKRLYGTKEAAEAIFWAVELENLYASLDRDPEDQGGYDRANLDKHLPDYASALGTIKAAFPAVGRCCDAFASGQCRHGKVCECGWLGAPWPWIIYRPGGAFCDCHLESRRAWSKAAGYRCWSSPDASEMWPEDGPHHGDGS